MPLKRIAVLGEIGSGNLGDDYGYVLLRDALRAAFEEKDVLVDIRPVTPNLFGLLGGYHWDAVVTGCGTLLDVSNGVYVRALTEASEKCTVAILGSGVSDARHAPPTADGVAAFIELTQRRAKHVWLRNVPESCAQFADGMLAPDPFWLMGWNGDNPERTHIGLNVGYAGFSTMNLDPGFMTTLRAARSLITHPVRLFAAWANDKPWIERVALPGEDIALVDGTRASLQLLDGCSAVLATRIHLAVSAACRGAFPVLPDYAGKVASVFASTNVPHHLLTLDADPQHIADILDKPWTSDGAAAVRAARAVCRVRVSQAVKQIMRHW